MKFIHIILPALRLLFIDFLIVCLTFVLLYIVAYFSSNAIIIAVGGFLLLVFLNMWLTMSTGYLLLTKKYSFTKEQMLQKSLVLIISILVVIIASLWVAIPMFFATVYGPAPLEM